MSVPTSNVGHVTTNLLATAPGGRLALGPAPGAGSLPLQVGFDELGLPLSEVTFVVVDLETTGGSATRDAITEVGAVKVRGGEVLGEFQTLVDPGGPVPPMITVLTGITDAMLIGAPRIEEVLPAFLEFAGFGPTTVLVAHNARFDVGFLRAVLAAPAFRDGSYSCSAHLHNSGGEAGVDLRCHFDPSAVARGR